MPTKITVKGKEYWRARWSEKGQRKTRRFLDYAEAELSRVATVLECRLDPKILSIPLWAEEIMKELNAAHDDVSTLQADNARLREALEFYARLKNWARTGPQWDQEMSPAEKDKGAIAANTLAQKPGCRSEKIEAPEVPASEAPKESNLEPPD